MDIKKYIEEHVEEMKYMDCSFLDDMSEEDRQAHIERETESYHEAMDWWNNMDDATKQEFHVELENYRFRHNL